MALASVVCICSGRSNDSHLCLWRAESATADVVVRLRANPGAVSPAELRVAIIGNVDSGKSTMVSTCAYSSHSYCPTALTAWHVSLAKSAGISC